ncbi:hypothetical protein sos41_15870 [Alphaproteobacteria bacterium SO-S41]|nr:hypothetical protein sos41_15870 [Alphaproteobacteria bacterium SO-S41]
MGRDWLTELSRLMPLAVGVGFLAPLIGDILAHYGETPLGAPPIVTGLIFGTALGGFVSWKRWLA